MEYQFKVIKERFDCKLLSFEDREFILIPGETPDQKELKNYLNISVMNFSENETLIEVEGNDYMEDLFDIISKKIEQGLTITKILEDVSELFLKQKSKREKFKEDYSKAAYLSFEGGNAVPIGTKFNFNHGEKILEIKSYSPTKPSVMMTIDEIRTTAIKIAYELFESEDGLTIIDLSELIKDSNSEFSTYLKARYSEDPEFNDKKFGKGQFKDVTDQLAFGLNIPNNVLDGKLKIYIDVE